MINSYLVDSLWTVKAPVPPRDKYNQPNAPIITAVKGLIKWNSKLVMDSSGEEVVSMAEVLLKTDSDLGHNDMLRIADPSRGENIDHPIITILPAKGYYTAGIYVYLGGGVKSTI